MADRERRERPRGRRPEPTEERHEHRTLEEARAHHARNSPGRESRGGPAPASEGVLTQVCETCGKEYYFDRDQPTRDLKCEKCGGVVFRSFFDNTRYDEVDADYRASTERDLAPNDDESDVTRADILDLNNP